MSFTLLLSLRSSHCVKSGSSCSLCPELCCSTNSITPLECPIWCHLCMFLTTVMRQQSIFWQCTRYSSSNTRCVWVAGVSELQFPLVYVTLRASSSSFNNVHMGLRLFYCVSFSVWFLVLSLNLLRVYSIFSGLFQFRINFWNCDFFLDRW